MKTRSTTLVAALPPVAFAAFAVVASACSAGSGSQDTQGALGSAGATTVPGAGGATLGAAGASVIGSGGSVQNGAGGNVAVGAGGSVIGAGGSVVGAGGTSSAGGTTSGSGAASSGGAGGPPPAGLTASVQTVDIPLAPGQESVKCQNFKNPIGKDVALLMTASHMVASHHMFVFHDPSFNADTNSVADCSGIEFHDLLHMSQTPEQKMQYPDGVGRSLKGTEGLRILIHLLNSTSDTLTAKVKIDLNYVEPTAVKSMASALFLNNALLNVPPGMSTQTRTSGPIPADIKVLVAVSHMHSRAVGFVAKTSDGQVLYQTTEWDEPVPAYFNPGLDVKQGSTITWSCTFNNTTGTTLTFGEHAVSNEMCILAGVAYPKQPGVDLGGLLEWVI